MSKSKWSQQQFAESWIRQTCLNEFFSRLTTQSQQPIIDVDAASDVESELGWCKYRYREVEKKTFKDSKEAAQCFLKKCPKEVIQHFINQSWWFMSAYHKGLTGAAAWAVHKQKQHWAINQRVMMAIDVLMNPAALVAGVAEA